MKATAHIKDATIQELQQGYTFAKVDRRFVCLGCHFRTEPGRIYPIGDGLFDAEAAMRSHICEHHQSPLHMLLALDKPWTGLSELQTRLISLFAAGISDSEIAATVNAGSVSTIRNHRFLLREKQKQAKVFLAIAELMEKQSMQASPVSAAVDGGNDAEAKKILLTYFPQGMNGPLSAFPTREKRRLILLRQISTRFTPGRRYTEPEVNAILNALYHDHVLLRRLLIDYGFLARRADGSEYWRTNSGEEMPSETSPASPANEREEEPMDERKKELIRQYKETPPPMGVFQIKNTVNGKLLLVKALNIPGIMNGRLMELRRGGHRNHELQADWNKYGEDAFVFETLATIKPADYPPEQWPSAVAELLKLWLEQLQPYGEAGYHRQKQ